MNNPDNDNINFVDSKIVVDTTFNVHSDARCGDPDIKSPTLRLYHKILWSKKLPSGETFDLSEKKSGGYLHHNSRLGEYFLGSDTITHSYRNQKRKQWLFKQLPEEKLKEIFRVESTVGSHIIFPNKKVDGKYTINQARGIHQYIDDRFDLTLECIRLFYLGQESPLFTTLSRYKNFFDLFISFKDYVNFFLLNDLVDDNENIKFYLPFDNFRSKPTFTDIEEYLIYRNGQLNFIKARNKRIDHYANKLTKE